MSTQSNVGSVTDRQKIDEDKCELYDSSRTDSGFISGEIYSDELTDSGVIEEKKKVGANSRACIDSGVIYEEDEDGVQGDQKKSVSMYVDSGVCLSENLSKISISQGFNDLDAPLKSKLIDLDSPVKEQKTPTKEVGEIPWKIYYEQNEDGDT